MAKTQLRGKTTSDDKNKQTGKAQKHLEQEMQSDTLSVQEIINTPLHSKPSSIKQLQQTIGNRAVQRIVESKPQRAGNSPLIQRHMGEGAKGLWASGEPLVLNARDNIENNTNTVSEGTGYLLLALDEARDEPVPQSGEGTPESGGENDYEEAMEEHLKTPYSG